MPLDSGMSGMSGRGGGDSGGEQSSQGLGGSNSSAGASVSPTTTFDAVSIEGRNSNSASSTAASGGTLLDSEVLRLKEPPKPGEFESWVHDVTGRKLKRYGSDLLIAGNRDFAVPATSTIPPDYALNVGDVVSISLIGSIEGSADFEINRNGQIFMPKVGTINLAGVHYRDLKDRVTAAIGRNYRGYEATVSIRKLRGVRVYVTGFANNPGAYTVNSLSTLANAVLAAGGPSAGGSFRSVKLYRNGHEVANFDLYQLLRKGDRAFDPLLQNEDVLFIPPAGAQIAVIGSVNEEAVYEALPGESLESALQLAGGPTNIADPSRILLYRLSDRDTVGSREILRNGASVRQLVEAGDILQLLPEGSLIRPLERQMAVVRIEGEVNRPGNYYVSPNTPLAEVLAKAGGLTPRAFVFGTRFSRESVRSQQRVSFLEAVNQMDLALAVAPLNGNSLIDAGERQVQIASAKAFVEKLRQSEPDGRLVLDVTPSSTSIPEIMVENNDRIVVPPRIDSVGVFGAVYRPASFLIPRGNAPHVKDYVEKAGGPIRGADRNRIFIVRANGSVLTKDKGAMNARVLPGDTVFVPIKTQSSSLLAKIRDIAQIFFGFGLSAAAIAAINN